MAPIRPSNPGFFSTHLYDSFRSSQNSGGQAMASINPTPLVTVREIRMFLPWPPFSSTSPHVMHCYFVVLQWGNLSNSYNEPWDTPSRPGSLRETLKSPKRPGPQSEVLSAVEFTSSCFCLCGCTCSNSHCIAEPWGGNPPSGTSFRQRPAAARSRAGEGAWTLP